MIQRARELASVLSNAEFVIADSEALPFPDATFTAVLCTASFHHYPNPHKALAEMRRAEVAILGLLLVDGLDEPPNAPGEGGRGPHRGQEEGDMPERVGTKR